MTILLKAATEAAFAALEHHPILEPEWEEDPPDAGSERADILCVVDDVALVNEVFEQLRILSLNLWENGPEGLTDPELALMDFEDIFFPSENGHSLPGRQVRGAYAWRLSRMHEEAAAARCSPAGMLRELEKTSR